MTEILRISVAPASTKTMWLGDTGAGMHCVTDIRMAVAGSVHANSTLIVTSNGPTRPKYRCEIDLPLCTDKGEVVTLHFKNVLILDNASHNLVSLGRLVTESHVELRVKATTGHASLTLPTGDIISLFNSGVLVVPRANASIAASPAVVTQGN
eukprot:3425812-Pleurochrysis_carterae.AAC.1